MEVEISRLHVENIKDSQETSTEKLGTTTSS